MIELILKTIWLLLPAYTPNNFAVVFGGGRPIDFGRKFIDGRRILGDGKTFRGFTGGVIGGIFIGIIQYSIEKIFKIHIFTSLQFRDFLILIFLLAIGSMLGDSIGSFIKRRLGYERGSRLLLIDQLTFLIFALLVASRFSPFWTLFNWEVILLSLILTPFLHLSVNYIAHKLNLKEVPW